MFHSLRAYGFIYYEVFVSLKTHTPIGWVSRKDEATPYTAFYCDGHRKAEASRGSAHNARQFIRDRVAKYKA